jgi:hypothetical protein
MEYRRLPNLTTMLTVDGWSAIANPPAYVVRIVHTSRWNGCAAPGSWSFRQLTEIDTADLIEAIHDRCPQSGGTR